MKTLLVLCIAMFACAPAERTIPVPPAAELSLQELGDSLRRLGDSASLAEAMSSYLAAESSAVARNDTLMWGVHLAAQASVRSLQGDREHALATYHRAAKLFEEIAHSNRSPTLAALGRTHARFGNTDSAVFYLQRALDAEEARTEPSITLLERLQRELDSISQRR